MESLENLVDDFRHVCSTRLAMAGHPGVELGSSHKDLPADSVVGKGMDSIVQILPELPHAHSAVTG
jgi:hypothetical protein